MKIGTNLALFKTHQVPHVLDPASVGSRWNSAAFRSDLQEVSYASFAGTVSLEWWSPGLSDLERLGLKNTYMEKKMRRKLGESWVFCMVLYGFIWFCMVSCGFIWFNRDWIHWHNDGFTIVSSWLYPLVSSNMALEHAPFFSMICPRDTVVPVMWCEPWFIQHIAMLNMI